MISKRRSRDEIISQFHDGQTIMTGGFGFHGVPFELLECVIESGAKHLTNIALDASAAKLMHLGIFDKVIMAHAGSDPKNLALVASGKIEVEYCPMGTLAERIRAGGVGLGGILVKTGMGTEVQKGKQLIEVDGETYMLEKALTADISLVCAATADHYGNFDLFRGAEKRKSLCGDGGRSDHRTDRPVCGIGPLSARCDCHAGHICRYDT